MTSNPENAIKIFEDLRNSFAALTFYTEADHMQVEALLGRTRSAIKNAFGEDSLYYREAGNIKLIRRRAYQENRESYFRNNKARMIDILNRIVDELRLRPVPQQRVSTPAELFPEIERSLTRFSQDYPEGHPTAFIMMNFTKSPGHDAITETIRQTLQSAGIHGLRADDKNYHDDLYQNILTYMHGCSFGIAVFERIMRDTFNPNVSFEVGYMLALHKRVCLLKDQTLSTLPTDLIGKLYLSFDLQDTAASIQQALSRWLAVHKEW